MPTTPFAELDAVLEQYVAGAQQVLGSEIIGAYLTGSFALGDADAGSDVDFLVVVRHPLTEQQAVDIQTMHRQVFDLPSHWAKHLEGSYFPADLLQSPDPACTPIPYSDNGSRDLEYSDHDNALVVRWVTREHGLALAGPPARDLIEPVAAADLRAEIRSVVHEWGATLLADPSGLDNGWRQPYVALSFARMLHTLDTGAVHSKRAAVGWARDHLDPQWTPLLERAWAKHPRQFRLYHEPADPADLALTCAFIRLAMFLTPLT